MAFLDGDTEPVVERLEAEMRQAAEELEFERAARLRDQLGVGPAGDRAPADGHRATPEDLDVVGDRRGRAGGSRPGPSRPPRPGRRAPGLRRREGRAARLRPQLIGRVLEQHYAETPLGVPRELLVPELPEDVDTYEAWLAGAA